MAPSELNDALPTLSAIAYSSLPENLGEYLQNVFHHAETIINSIPSPPAIEAPLPLPSTANFAKTPEDTICHPYADNDIDVRHASTQAAWGKPVKINAKENPLGIAVFKMSGHDKNGAWFARRSLHQGLGFTRWKKMMQREFDDEIAETGGPGAGAVRGITADRQIEKHEVKGVGQLAVYQLSAQFPGPVAPREFVTLLHTSENALTETSALKGTGKPPRHFMVVSRPTQHPDAPPRSDLVLGTYESIEMIRELPKAQEGADPETNPVEWIMITRSDPGGGIPRFMVERGTPGSVVADTSKFLKWALSREDTEIGLDGAQAQTPAKAVEPQQDLQQSSPPEQAIPPQTNGTPQPTQTNTTQGGFMSTLSGGFEAAVATVAPSYLATVQHAIGTKPSGEDVGDDSDTSDSDDGYTSAEEGLPSSPSAVPSTPAKRDRTTTISSIGSETSIARPTSINSTSSPSSKLAQKHAAIDAKLAKLNEDHEKKLKDVQDRDMEHTTKEQEKMEKERRKQEAKLHAERQKLEEQATKDAEKADKEAKKAAEKAAKEAKKAEEKRAKEVAKEEERRAKELAKDELTLVKAERDEHRKRADEAEKEVEVLRKQLEELQRGQTAQAASSSTSNVSLRERTGTLVIG